VLLSGFKAILEGLFGFVLGLFQGAFVNSKEVFGFFLQHFKGEGLAKCRDAQGGTGDPAQSAPLLVQGCAPTMQQPQSCFCLV
jgi:hypothetical protein